MRKFLFAALLFASASSLTSCEKDSPTTKPINFDLPYDMIIVNEGNAGKTNASFSLYFESKDSVANDVFKKVNGRVLGDGVQSLKIADSLGYFVSGIDGKIEVVSLKTLKSKATISDFSTPRYMEVYNGKGYVSEWGNDAIVIIDLASNKIIKRIKVGLDPEGMLIVGNKLYVANSSGYETDKKDNKISIINLSTETIEKEITLADRPKCLTLDKNRNVWVLCAGFSKWGDPSVTTNAALFKIDPATYATTKIDLGPNNFDRLEINPTKDKLYYCSSWGFPSGIFQIDITAKEASTAPFIDGGFYNFSINPSNGEIIGMIADWSVAVNNKMVRYNSKGIEIKKYTVGIGPNGGYFVK